MKTTVAKLIMTAAFTTIAGLALTITGARADDVIDVAAPQTITVQSTTTTNLNLYSNNLAQVQATQEISFPAGYNLDAVRNVNSQAAANALEQTAQQGLYTNNYQSDPTAATQVVDLNSLTADQVSQLNQYGLNLVNRARAEFGLTPFSQDTGTINQVRSMALQYQAKDESLLKGDWHDYEILQGQSENIAAHQVYHSQPDGAPLC